MAIFGFIVMLLGGLGITVLSACAISAVLAISGKVDIGLVIFLLIGIGAIVLAVVNSPFTVTIAGG
jgi:hypothetical protein